MHLAKGLEFRAVVVVACDDGIIPLEGRIEEITDDADLEEVYNTERNLLCRVRAYETSSECEYCDYRNLISTVE